MWLLIHAGLKFIHVSNRGPCIACGQVGFDADFDKCLKVCRKQAKDPIHVGAPFANMD